MGPAAPGRALARWAPAIAACTGALASAIATGTDGAV